MGTGFQPSLAFVRRVSPAESRAGGQAGGTGWLGQVVRGYLAYHAVPTNSQAITSFVHYVTWHWKRALGRCSQKGHVTWTRMEQIAAHGCRPPGSSTRIRSNASSSNTRGGSRVR